MIISLTGLTGRHTVDTESHIVDVDLDARIAIVLDMDAEAAGLHSEPIPFLFDAVECVAGQTLEFDNGDFGLLSFGTVYGITRSPVEVAA